MRRASLEVARPMLWFVAAVTVGCVGESDDGRDDGQEPYVASEACPLKSPAEWQAFLTTAVNDERWVSTCSDLQNCDELVGPFRQHVTSDVVSVFEACTTDVAEHPRIDRCTERLRRYLPVWLSQHADDSYGFRQTNHDYLAAHTGPDVPVGMMDPPAALLAALPDRAAIEAAARDNGWPYLTHDSCLGGVRTFVAVSDPEDRFDEWMLVGLDAALVRVNDPTVVSFIGVQKKDASGELLPQLRLHFRDYLATESGGTFTLELPENFGGKCYACHASGMRQLIPMRETIAESAPVSGEEGYGEEAPENFGLERLARLNELLNDYGLPDWFGSIDPADHGPPLGGAPGCTDCHDGVDRGVLTVTTSEGVLWQKVVGELSMRSTRDGHDVPDLRAMTLRERERTADPPLTPDETAALERARAEHLSDYQALVAERFPAWRQWILEFDCD